MSTGGILVDRELATLIDRALIGGAHTPPIAADQIQPASIDLRLGAEGHRLRAGFLPSATCLSQRLEELSLERVTLDAEGVLLERGEVWLIRLEEELHLPADLRGRLNPRSTTGRCDLFTRTLIDGHSQFDVVPAGYRGGLWLEVSPLSFPVRLRRGDRLCQLRLARGPAALDGAALRAAWQQEPMAWIGDHPLDLDEAPLDEDGGLALTIGLAGRDPCGWRARRGCGPLDFARDGGHAREDFWEEVRAEAGHCVLEPDRFTIFASRERIRIPPGLAAEMVPVDVGLGEMRNNYAGFFDPGFGWHEPAGQRPPGTPAVLEVRAHDVPFLIEDGQVAFRLRFFRCQGRPERLYGEGRSGGSYAHQDLTLARSFR
jgi:dCTP deaminase